MSTHSPNTHLSTTQCWALLETHRVGRLALTDDHGTPDVFPVNYVAYEGAVYIRTAPDIKDVRISERPAVAFEVDGHDESGWWSVVVRGLAARVSDVIEVERSGIGGVVSASPRHKPHVLKIAATAVTGRRFADRPDPPATPSHPPTGATATSEPSPTPPPEHRRGERPRAIPSHPPVSDAR